MQPIKQSESTAARRNMYFFAADVNNPSQPKTGLTFATTDLLWIKNGGSPASSAGSVTEVSAANAPGLYFYQPTATECDTLGPALGFAKHASMVAKYIDALIQAIDPYASVENQVWDALPSNHTVASSFGEMVGNTANTCAAGSTTTSIVTNLTSTSTDKYKDQWLCFLSGNNAGECHLVTAYNGTTKTLTVTTAFSNAPASTDRFILISR